jgi:hypothetical protein
MREMKNGFKIMDGIPDGKRALGKYRSRWLVNTVMNIRTGNFFTTWVTIIFLRRTLLHDVNYSSTQIDSYNTESRYSPPFVESDFSQEPTTEPYLEPYECSPQVPNLFP